MMNLRQATRSVLFGLLVFFTALIALFFWTVNALTEPYEALTQFRSVREKILLTTAAQLDDYFHTSNSLSLKQAQDTVAEVLNETGQLPSHLHLQLRVPLQTLQRSLNDEISAGGEMAANPDALLEQNEREIAGWLINFEQYAEDAPANRAAEVAHYRQIVLNMATALQHLGRNREKAFEQNAVQENVFVSDLRQLEMNFAQLRNLPLLGVLETTDEQDDELSLGLDRKQKTAARDRALTYRDELASLIARYPREWGYALRDQRMSMRAQAALKAELNAVSDALETADKHLTDWRQHDTMSATYGFLSLMLLLMVLIGFIGWNMKRRVITPLLRTTRAIREIDDAHGWQLQVPVQAVGELHELADNVNAFIAQVRNEKALDRKVA